MALEKWLTAELLSVMDETENTKRFFFKVPELDTLPFRAGQFITFDLPISDKKIKRYRSYSIASAPNATNEFELIISYAPNGLGTNYLWNQIKVGSTISFKGPSGMFTL
ncbi:MAG: oxidoreductase, partial [Chitinophagales bacterium]|nr:oxidoreductase [Chitinophagales bacterium]